MFFGLFYSTGGTLPSPRSQLAIGAVCYLIIERDGGYNLIRIRYHDTVFNCLENIFLMTNAQFVGDDVTGDET